MRSAKAKENHSLNAGKVSNKRDADHLRRLKRDLPEVAERVVAGEIILALLESAELRRKRELSPSLPENFIKIIERGLGSDPDPFLRGFWGNYREGRSTVVHERKRPEAVCV